MKKIRLRIAALVGGSVLLTLLLIMGGFNIIISRKVRREADSSMRRTFSSEEAEEGAPLYSPEIIRLMKNDSDNELLAPQIFTPKEQSIIEWCRDNKTYETRRADIDGGSYYILLADPEKINKFSMSWYTYFTGASPDGTGFTFKGFDELTGDGAGIAVGGTQSSVTQTTITDPSELDMLISYIDVTGEIEMIKQINLVFLIAAFVIGAFGSTMGYFIGRKLEQNQLAQKQFFENTSHELKTPLTSIRGYAEGIEKGVITDYAKTGRVIAAQTEKMSGLVEEILCMAKLESGSVSLEKEPVELTAFLQDCLMPFEGTVLTRGLNVELQLDKMTVSADPEKLEHAISNLLTNALKYARTEIRISCGGGVIRIENDCEPLTDDALRHLFDRFYTGRGGNTGLGLSIARDLIALHGWKLTAERTESGVRFTIKC